MNTVEFEISDDDLKLVVELLEDVHAEVTYRQVWHAVDSELARRMDGAAPMPIRLDRDRAIEFGEWLTSRAHAHATSADAGDQERGRNLARVAIAIESVLNNR